MQPSVWLYAQDAGLEEPLCIAERIHPFAAIETLVVFLRQVLRETFSVLLQILVVARYEEQHIREHGMQVFLLPCDLRERHRIRRIADECLLVDIQSDTSNAARYAPLCIQHILYEHAADLLVLPIDVVRPLHAHICYAAIQGLLHTEGDDFREDELLARLHEIGIQHEAEEQILALLTFPAIAPLPLSCRLEIGHHGA